MASKTQDMPGYFVWDAPDHPLTVQLSLDVVERMGSEILRGFAAVPKRGAEVGGFLLGSVDEGARTVVRVERIRGDPDGVRARAVVFSLRR
jgi:hypothetical protein